MRKWTPAALKSSTNGLPEIPFGGRNPLMTCLRNITRFAVVFFTLVGIMVAAIPAGWIALRYEPPQGEEKGYWVLVKEPADGIDAWWSDEELAKIVAGDADYIQHLETDWSPEAHPAADPVEAKELTEELAEYWEGDLPQANFWAHGALTRRGDTPNAYRWSEDGLTQRETLEAEGSRPSIPTSPVDPDPVDTRWNNSDDVVTYGDRWGSHLQTGALTHINQAEGNRLKRQYQPNSPPAGKIEEATVGTVEDCRKASLQAELDVFENYVRAWGGLEKQDVSFGMPENCVTDPGPPVQIAVNPPPRLSGP